MSYSKQTRTDPSIADELNMIEIVLSARMAKDKTDGFRKFLRASRSDATIDEIKSALVSFENDISRLYSQIFLNS